MTLRVPACTRDGAVPTLCPRDSWWSLALTSRCRYGIWELGWGPGQWFSPLGPAGGSWRPLPRGKCSRVLLSLDTIRPRSGLLTSRSCWCLGTGWGKPGLFEEFLPTCPSPEARKAGEEAKGACGFHSVCPWGCACPLLASLPCAVLGAQSVWGVRKLPECPAPSRSCYWDGP